MRYSILILTLFAFLILGCDNGQDWVVNIESTGSWSADFNGKQVQGQGNYRADLGNDDRACCTVVNRSNSRLRVWVEGGESDEVNYDQEIIVVCGVK